jgi:hypothetical protein
MGGHHRGLMQINPQMQALDFGFRCIRFFLGVPLYVKNLFPAQKKLLVFRKRTVIFFRKNYKISHALFMIYRLGWKISNGLPYLLSIAYKKRNDTVESRDPCSYSKL